MELARRKNAPPIVLDGWLTDLGHTLGKTMRSSVDIAGRAIGVIATRGGADEVVTVTGDAPVQDNTLWYALGVAGIAVVAVVAIKKRKKR